MEHPDRCQHGCFISWHCSQELGQREGENHDEEGHSSGHRERISGWEPNEGGERVPGSSAHPSAVKASRTQVSMLPGQRDCGRHGKATDQEQEPLCTTHTHTRAGSHTWQRNIHNIYTGALTCCKGTCDIRKSDVFHKIPHYFYTHECSVVAGITHSKRTNQEAPNG